jgi:hypothetical protein
MAIWSYAAMIEKIGGKNLFPIIKLTGKRQEKNLM